MRSERSRLDVLDLHGFIVDDALMELETFLFDRYRRHYLKVLVIHGKGTGAVKDAVRFYLDDCPIVESYNDADSLHGGTGAAEVWFVSRKPSM